MPLYNLRDDKMSLLHVWDRLSKEDIDGLLTPDHFIKIEQKDNRERYIVIDLSDIKEGRVRVMENKL